MYLQKATTKKKQQLQEQQKSIDQLMVICLKHIFLINLNEILPNDSTADFENYNYLSV